MKTHRYCSYCRQELEEAEDARLFLPLPLHEGLERYDRNLALHEECAIELHGRLTKGVKRVFKKEI